MRNRVHVPNRNIPNKKLSRLEWLLCIVLAIGLTFFCIQRLEAHYLPAFQSITSAKISNEVTNRVNQTITEQVIKHVSYGDLVTLERDSNGTITAMTTNMAEINLLKSQTISQTADIIAALDPDEFSIPLGSLTNITFLSGKGMRIPVKGFTAGTINAELDQDFSQAGINQTRHRIVLNITVPVQILLAGNVWTEEIKTDILIAETVIVGTVPNTYLQIENPN